MNVIWLIEKYMFDYIPELIEMIKKSGAKYHIFDDTENTFDFKRSIQSKYTEQDCVIFYGSLQRGRQIYNQTNFIPGVFLTIDNYECSKYYGYYGNHLVNSNYILLGLNDVKRNIDKIFEQFNTPSIFIRPSNGYKTFTGQLLPKDNFETEFKILCNSYGGLDPNQLVLLAPQQKIIEENRFIVFNIEYTNQIIDGNTYMINGELVKERKTDDLALSFAKTVVDLYTPDKAFTIDIAKMEDNSYKVLEIGSFCCAGWYNMDLEKVVHATNKLALSEFSDYWNLF